MKFSSSDFRLMRFNIAAFVSSLFISSVILYGSDLYSEHAQRDYRTANNQMRDARMQLNTARLDQEYLATYSKDYADLEKRRIIGDDHRLDWLEGLDRLRRQNLVLDANYSIAPLQPYSPQPFIDSGNLDIHYSEMKLQFDLLHEGQLLDFLNSLRYQIKGLYQISGCNIERTALDSNTARIGANLKAECTGGWITLKNRNDPQ